MPAQRVMDFVESGMAKAARDHLQRESDQRVLTEEIARMAEIGGMPLGAREAILDLSLAPFSTACPNPFISREVGFEQSGDGASAADGAHAAVTAFAADISAGKNDPLYFAHYYSTKVPPGAIVPYILHYTQPGEVVFDGFCGTGMTGVAAQLCGDPARVDSRNRGPRRAILSDLSPAAAFIAAGTNAIGLFAEYLDEIEAAVRAVAVRFDEALHTAHVGWPRGTADPASRINDGAGRDHDLGRIEYVVWSDVFFCSACGSRIVYWDLVFRGPRRAVPKHAPCPSCGSVESIATLQRAWRSHFDMELERTVRQAEQVPVLINYSLGSLRFEKTPDERDLAIIAELERASIHPSPPVAPLPDGFNTEQPRRSHGYSHTHHFFTRRNLAILSEFQQSIGRLDTAEARFFGRYVLTGAIQRVCRLNRYMPNHDRHVGPLSGTLYVAPLTVEIPATNYLADRIKALRRCRRGPRGRGVLIGTQSATDLRNMPDAGVDYIFTDPPFGGNLNYSELNTLVEAWLGMRTDATLEAVVNDVRKKDLFDYQETMRRAFAEFHRVLKPGRWITIEFHNSRNAVWAAIQEALSEAGFVIADVRVLDKKKGTTKQLSYGATVRQDLAISAYKPDTELLETFALHAGTEEGVWDFVRRHLHQLPVSVLKNGRMEAIAERHNFLIFDRMVAFHVLRGVAVPMDAAEFYAGLARRFQERDGMYFLPGQVAEYERERLTVSEAPQIEIFVVDESSAIQWLRRELSRSPQTFQSIQPRFLREIGGWQKHERALELADLLDQNFLCYDGMGDVPGRLRDRLSAGIDDDPTVRARARDCWYVPDPNEAGDLEKLRERALLKEFDEYRESAQRTLKVFRLEAVRAGFRRAWQTRDYGTIVAVAGKLPDAVLHEDPKLLMWYDQALTRSEADR